MKKLMKIILVLTLLFNFFIINIDKVFAAELIGTITDRDGLNIRSGPGTNYDKIAGISYNATITLVSTTKHPGAGCDGWYQINYAGSTDRYLCSEGVSVANTSDTGNGYYTSNSWGNRIVEDYANVRSTPNGSIIDKIFLGTKVNILGESGSYYRISYYNGQTGYILKKLCKNFDEIAAIDQNYNETLKTAGFPESYWPFLTLLHQKHPTWTFKADQTNKDFSEAVKIETGKNYIPSTIDAFRTDNIPKEGIYYTASSSVVAVYMDPRNYLNESSIFAFEALSYDESTQTPNILKTMFNGTYLQADNYINAYIEAAKTYNISPVHLASRSKQEGATNEEYMSVSGTSGLTYNGNSLNGIYNFYNIGAYGETPVTRGLAVAAGYINYDAIGTPWNTREKAIIYGAAWIADGYISKGQDTMYYQKFNTKATSQYSPYTHQYMTNILAPASESLSTYTSYESLNLLGTAYTFYIPVYNNMPTEYTIMPPIGDTNNNLSNLTVNGQTVTGFDSDVIEYISYVTYDTTQVSINGTSASQVASIEGFGTFDIIQNETTFNIIVTSQVNESKTYKITVIKEQKPITPPTTPGTDETTHLTPDEIVNNMDVKFSNGYLTYIPIGTTATTLINDVKSKDATANATIKDISGNNKENSSLATGDTLTITSNNETKEYAISINGDANGDGQINSFDTAAIIRDMLGYKKLEGVFKDAGDANHDGVINSFDTAAIIRHMLGYKILR